MSRPVRFFVSWFMATLAFFCSLGALFGVYYGFRSAEVRYLQEQQAELEAGQVIVDITDPDALVRQANNQARLAFATVAGGIAFYLLLILTVYVVIGQFFAAEQPLYEEPRRYSLLIIGAWMLIGGALLLMVAYLNLWAAPDFFLFQGCRIAGAGDCDPPTAVIAVIVQQWLSYIAMALSLPVLLLGLIIEDLEGWEF
ncbi:MAG: hypothetical protein AAFU54_11155 [Chloroflexota bacterium]